VQKAEEPMMSGPLWPMWFIILVMTIRLFPIVFGLALMAFFNWWYPVSWALVLCAIGTAIYSSRFFKKW